MDVVYEQSIFDKIGAAKVKAKRIGRTINHIELTKDEWKLMVDEARHLQGPDGFYHGSFVGYEVTRVDGVTIKIKE